MPKTVVKNETRNNHPVCPKCVKEIFYGRVYKHVAYCEKCYEILKGIRDSNGMKVV